LQRFILLLVLLTSIAINAQDTYLHCGTLINTKKGTVEHNKTIVVSGNKIIAINNGYAEPKKNNAIIIDLKSKTVMSGLIDMHVHLEGESNPKKYL